MNQKQREIMQPKTMIVAVVAAMLVAGGTVQAVTIDTVPVGDPGNAADMRYNLGPPLGRPEGYGAVSYTYNIGKYEVTAGQYTEFLNAVARTDAYDLYNPNMDTISNPEGCNIKRSGSFGTYTYTVASDWADRPVNWVSWGDAARFANWLTNGQPSGTQALRTTEDGAYYLNGATGITALMAVLAPSAAIRASWTTGATPHWLLPSEDEWYKAAYYKGDSANAGYWDYPTGTNSVPNNALLSPDPGNYANFKDIDGITVTIGEPYWRTVVGEFESSCSPYSTFDQAGNVWEWNDTRIDYFGSYRLLRGGSIYNVGDYLHAAARLADNTAYEYNDIGFRVAMVPEPATMVLTALGGLVLLTRRCCNGGRRHAGRCAIP